MDSAWQRAVSVNVTYLRRKVAEGGEARLTAEELCLSSGVCPFDVSAESSGEPLREVVLRWQAPGEDSRLFGGTVVGVAWRQGSGRVALVEASVAACEATLRVDCLGAEPEGVGLSLSVFACNGDFSTRCAFFALEG